MLTGDAYRLKEALGEFLVAFEDAMRRFYAGDARAIESYMLHATYRAAKEVFEDTPVLDASNDSPVPNQGGPI